MKGREIVAVGAGLFVLLGWYYLDLFHIPFIDPLISDRPPGPATDLFFHIQDSLDDLARWLPFWILFKRTSYMDRIEKYVWLVLSAHFLFAFIDLQITGNQEPNIIHPTASLLALSYGAAVWILFWRDKPEKPLSPSVAYRIERKPRSLTEWVGSIVFARWAGSVSHYGNGNHYLFNPKTLTLEAQKVDNFHPRPDQRAVPLKIRPEELDERMGKMLGEKWSLGACFRVSQEISKKR